MLKFGTVALAIMIALALLNGKAVAQSDCFPVPPGLVGWWTGDFDARDIAGGHDGVLTNGAVAGAPGMVGGAFNFDGIDDYVSMGDVLNFERTDSFSIFAWIKTAVAGECCGQRMVTKQSNVQPDIPGSFMLHISAGGGLGNQLVQDQVRDLFETTDPSSQAINDTKWHLVGVTYDGSSTLAGHKLYIDGQMPPILGSGNDLTGSILTTADLQISGRDGPNFVWNGLIDEVAIFDRELSASEVLAIYNAGSEGMCKGMPPICDAGGPYSAQCQGASTTILLHGTASSDPDGNPLTFQWSSGCPGATFDDPTSPTPELTLDTPTGMATCTVFLTIDDGVERTSCEATITVDGLDTDSDGLCNAVDSDDDNDGVLDGTDSAPLNPNICEDNDGDECDDCAIGQDGFGPLPDNLPANDGLDTDGDGLCDAGDTDDDNDGLSDAEEMACGSSPTNANSTCEVCDDKDNDLDGMIDEGNVCPCFSVTSLQCADVGGDAILNWTNGDSYDLIWIFRNSMLIATLGTATSYTDPALLPGTYIFEVQGVCELGLEAAPESCTVVIDPCEPVSDLACSSRGNNVSLSWHVQDTYDLIRVFRDSVLIAELEGSTTAYTDEDVPCASAYELQGICTTATASATLCEVDHCPPNFLRGDCDGDVQFNGLLDGLEVLNYQFIPGFPEPPCLEACDADGNSVLNGLVDALWLLNHQFNPGEPPPPAPYPSCGPDADLVNSLGCGGTSCP